MRHTVLPNGAVVWVDEAVEVALEVPVDVADGYCALSTSHPIAVCVGPLSVFTAKLPDSIKSFILAAACANALGSAFGYAIKCTITVGPIESLP